MKTLSPRPLCDLRASAVPSSPTRIDCGHDHPYGICPKCKRGHGYQIEISPTLAKAMRSLRVVAHLNLRQACDAKKQNRPRMYAYHLQVALDCRRDANALRVS